jgi:NAD kinase
MKNFKKSIKNAGKLIKSLKEVNNQKILLGKLLSNSNSARTKEIIDDVNKSEFQVFSQWGDDGIIDFLASYLDIKNKTFIEFGVENYEESNTRFLLINRNWTGFIMDGSAENIDYVKNDSIYWRYDINAKHAFITKENINELLNGFHLEK